MRRNIEWLLFVFVALLLSFSTSTQAAELEEHLLLLQPLIGVEWVGGYVGPEAPDLEISLSFEPILDGKAVRYTREAPAANFTAVTHFYWNTNCGELCFLNLNNRGIVEEGIVTIEGDGLVLHGSSHWSDRTIEFRTTLKIDAGGKLSDTFIRKEDGEWVQGHFQEFLDRD